MCYKKGNAYIFSVRHIRVEMNFSQPGANRKDLKFGRFRTRCGPICRLCVGSLSILGNTSRDRSLDVPPRPLNLEPEQFDI